MYDEARVSNIARSPDWIAAEYSNQNSPSSFYTVGSQQTGGGGGGNVSITVTSSVGGMLMTVDGNNCTAPCSFTWASGSNHTISAPAGSGGSAWSQGYNYDGFGNLTAITGTQPNSFSIDPATNHGPYSDANGNGLSISSSGPYTFDIENRLVLTDPSTGSYSYSYAPGNKRVWRGTTTFDSGHGVWLPATDEITFWSPSGQKLATYSINTTWVQSSVDGTLCATAFNATQTGTNLYFGGKLIKNAPGNVYSDRLGSIGQYYPYGTDKGSNPASGEKFTGYNQDSETGLDYAINRYQQPGSGRFLTTDPLDSSAIANDPRSWNRYAYVGGDPVNNFDPSGQDYCLVDDPYDCVPDEFCEDLINGPIYPAKFTAYCVNGVYGDPYNTGGELGGGSMSSNLAPITAPVAIGIGICVTPPLPFLCTGGAVFAGGIIGIIAGGQPTSSGDTSLGGTGHKKITPERRKECDKQKEADDAICRVLRKASCWDQAAQRYAACLAGRSDEDLPPFPYKLPARTPRASYLLVN